MSHLLQHRSFLDHPGPFQLMSSQPSLGSEAGGSQPPKNKVAGFPCNKTLKKSLYMQIGHGREGWSAQIHPFFPEILLNPIKFSKNIRFFILTNKKNVYFCIFENFLIPFFFLIINKENLNFSPCSSGFTSKK